MVVPFQGFSSEWKLTNNNPDLDRVELLSNNGQVFVLGLHGVCHSVIQGYEVS